MRQTPVSEGWCKAEVWLLRTTMWGPDHTHCRHSDTSFPLLFHRAGHDRGTSEDITRMLASWCGNNEKVSEDGDGVWQGRRAPGAWWQNLFHKCGEVSSAPGHVVAAGWHLFATLSGWQDCELRNWPPPKGQVSPLPRLVLAWHPSGEITCWRSSEQLYYRFTYKGVGAGETVTRWQEANPEKRLSAASNFLKPNDANQTSLTPQASSVGLETFLLTYQAPHQSVAKDGFLCLASAPPHLVTIIHYHILESQPSLPPKAWSKQSHQSLGE